MQKTILLSLLVSLSTFGATEPQSKLRLSGESLKFSYQSFDGEKSVRCTHEVENAAGGDWRVFCSEGNFHREYTVHLWITRYSRLQAPRTSFETLYWVTERYPQAGVGYSTSNWLHLAESTNFYGASLSVGVDSETAGLYLEVLTPVQIR